MHAGGSPAATHFLCVAKESKQRKATAKPLPFGFPPKCRAKREANETRFPCRAHSRLQAAIVTQARRSAPRNPCYTSDNVHFLIRLTHHFGGSVKADFTATANSKARQQLLHYHSTGLFLVLQLPLTLNPWRSAEEMAVQAEREVNVV
jgi:hypothetical protein